MEIVQYFLKKYGELEEAGSHYYKLTNIKGEVVQNLAKLPEFSNIKKRLDYCRTVRNLIIHNDVAYDFRISPSDKMIQLLETLIEQIHRIPLCRDFAIRTSNIFSCSVDDLVLPAMNIMKEKNYTHVPILNDNVLAGVFSENTLFAYLLENEIITVDKDTKFTEISQYLPINNHVTETFHFLPWDARVFEAKELFEKALKKMERVGMIFLTQNGRPTEKLVGILTPWDILANQLLV